MSRIVLAVSDLKVDFYNRDKLTNSPLRGLDFEVAEGRTLGIVGETGCGKTLTGMAILGLLPPNARRSGKIWLDGTGELNPNEMSEIRGSKISFIFQNPHSAFNPVFTIGDQLTLVARRHNIPRKSVQAILCERLVAVGLADTTRVLSSYPHQLSGGMLQRCMIAMALITNPKLLIADEPTTALDTTIARQILSLMLKLQEEHGFAMILISHDVEIISDLSDDIAVLYAGKIVETGPTSEVVNHPSHPYTTGLLGAIPQAGIGRGELAAIPGQVPSSSLSITGCAFAPRCQHRLDICESEPTIVQINDHKVACWMGQS